VERRRQRQMCIRDRYAPAEKFVEDDVWKTLPGQADWFPAWSKRMGEILLEACKVQYGYEKWAIIRPANIFGEYDDFNGKGTVIASTIKKVYEATDSIEAWGDGTPVRDFVYAGDVANAIIKLYENRLHTTINFGSGEEVSIKEMIEMIIEVSKKDISIIWDTTKPNGDLRRLMDVSKQEKYGLVTQTKLKESIYKVYEYYTKSIR
jgi:GDP-L-fucose synthase